MKSNNYLLLKGYIQEDPKVYGRVVVFSLLIGFFEFVGVSFLMPVISLFLGEPVTGVPVFVESLVLNVVPFILVVLFLFMVLFQSGLNILNEFFFVSAMARWRTSLSMDYVKNILDADFRYYNQLNPGEMEVMITRNIGFAMKIRHRTAVFLSENILALFYIGIALYISIYTFFLFLMVGLIYYLINRHTLHLRMEYSLIAKEKYIKSSQHISEYFSDIRTLLSYPKHFFMTKVSAELIGAADAQRKTDKINVFVKHIHQPVMLLLIFCAIGFSKSWLELENAKILVMLYIFYRAAPKMIEVAKGYGEIIGDSPSDVTPEIIKWKELARLNPGVVLPETDYSIEIIGGRVCFGDEILLDDLDFSIPNCSLNVIVGKSGSGKSTLLDVLCGFRKITEGGELRIGGLDSGELDFEQFLQKHVALVKPESVIVSGSIAENIAYLSDTIDREQIELLVTQLKLDDFLDERKGIDTYIDARGANLSAGQRQRIVIARALYKQPTLLLLDEPTSNLDRKTEQDVNNLIAELKGKITMLIVSHREGILSLADSVYKVEEKRMNRVERIDA